MSKKGVGKVMIGLAAVMLVTGVSRVDAASPSKYRCTATNFSYAQESEGLDFKDRWVTRIGFTKQGKKLTWSVDAKWNHRSEGFKAEGTTQVTLDGFGLFSLPVYTRVPDDPSTPSIDETRLAVDDRALQAASTVEQVGADFPNILFEPLNHGVYPKALGLFNLVTQDIYQGCPAAPPTSGPFIINVCSDKALPTFGLTDVAMPSVPRYPDRTFCASFDFMQINPNDGSYTPSIRDAVFAPVDFVDLSRG